DQIGDRGAHDPAEETTLTVRRRDDEVVGTRDDETLRADLPARAEDPAHADDLPLIHGQIDEGIGQVRVLLVLPRQVRSVAGQAAVPEMTLESGDLAPKVADVGLDLIHGRERSWPRADPRWPRAAPRSRRSHRASPIPWRGRMRPGPPPCRCGPR